MQPVLHLPSCLIPQEQRAPCAQESILSPARCTPCSPPVPAQGPEPRVPAGAAVSPPASPLSDTPSGGERGWGDPSISGTPEQALAWDPSETSMLLLPPRGPGGLGGTVNLILSIGKKGEKKKVQIEEAPRTVRGAGRGACRAPGCPPWWHPARLSPGELPGLRKSLLDVKRLPRAKDQLVPPLSCTSLAAAPHPRAPNTPLCLSLPLLSSLPLNPQAVKTFGSVARGL